MNKEPSTFYKYSEFDTKTLESLCNDSLYFANPGTFNDPLDCNPTVVCDSDLEQLRELLSMLIRRHVFEEMQESLKKARLKGENATKHAEKHGEAEAARILAHIAYHATNPDYKVSKEVAEKWLLAGEIERELLKHYERGVCCFSTTYSSPLLWSHYGDQHRGLCIGYGTDRKPQPQLRRVVYGGSRAIKTSTLFRSFIQADQTAIDELDRDVLLRKAKGWSYEREWRLIDTQGVKDSPLLLKEITFGLRCSPAVMHTVIQALAGRERPVKYYQIREPHSRFLLRRRTFELCGLPSTAISALEAFGE
jgi:hypothetical protein